MNQVLPENQERAAWAKAAVNHFARNTQMEDEELQTRVQDLMTDLFHLCHQKEIPLQDVLRLATQHFEEER